MQPQNQKDALVAQLVEHLTLNQGVQGSTPCRRTKEEVNESLSLFFSYIFLLQSDPADLLDTLDGAQFLDEGLQTGIVINHNLKVAAEQTVV